MFGVLSLSTVALVVLYFWGFVMMMKAGLKAEKSWWASAAWAVVWPASAYKVINDLWKTAPPEE